MKRTVLSIASSDSSGGAGVQADLRAFSIAGVHGFCIITCLTAQTPDKVHSVTPLNIEFVKEQAEQIFKKIKPNVVKIGMVYSKEILNYISDLIENVEVVVADPVFKASDGTELCEEGYIDVYRRKILPISYLITPNFEEAKLLAEGEGSVEELSADIFNMGAENVLIKGGHLKGKDSIDTFFDGKRFYRFSLPRIPRYRWHGTGCTFSSLIAANLAKGMKLRESIDLSKRILWSMMLNSYSLKGSKVRILGKPKDIDIPPKNLDRERFDVWLSLNSSVKRLIKILPSSFIPEVGVNMGFALKNAKGREDVCALKGRITRAKTYRILKFGASKHISSIILTAMKFDKAMRSALNIRYSSDLIGRIKSSGLIAYSFNREEEPEYAKSTMEWGVSHVIKKYNRIPDVIWDEGGMGKESMIRILGKNPKEVIGKLKQILD